MTTHDWETLLDGTTPGPWVPSRSGYIGSVTGDMIYAGAVAGRNEADTNLIAAAPDAVAEVIRLRRGIEASIAQYQFIQTFADHPQALGVLGQIIPDLTRILEGDTNEQH